MRRERKQKSVTLRRPRTQREVLRDVLLSANECDAWLTLEELAAMTRYPAASISAQLRHLKKPQFGNYVVEKQLRTSAHLEDGQGAVWEYRLTRRRIIVQRKLGKKKAGTRLAQPALLAAPEVCSSEMAVC